MVNVTPTDLPQHTYHATAYIFNGNQTVPIDFTYSVTDTPALQQPMVQDTSNRQSVEVPTTEQTTEQPANGGVEIVTPRTPLPTSLAVISVVAGIVIWRRRND
jgi:carbohydrate-binding DOMON domain-containing protein